MVRGEKLEKFLKWCDEEKAKQLFRPIDKQSAMSMRPIKNTGFSYSIGSRIHSKLPLPTETISVSKKEHDLTGKRFGHFTVIGAFPLYNKNDNRLWVVRCVCGCYEAKRRRSLINRNTIAMCLECEQLDNKKNEIDPLYRQKMKDKLIIRRSDGRFFKENGEFKNRYNVGDLIYNQEGIFDVVEFVSKRSIKFKNNFFKKGDIIKKKIEI